MNDENAADELAEALRDLCTSMQMRIRTQHYQGMYRPWHGGESDLRTALEVLKKHGYSSDLPPREI
jgi:hypothetical protein